MKKLQQFYIRKFNSSTLKKNKFNIARSINDARKNGELVALGDSQFLRTIRDTTNHPFTEKKLETANKEYRKKKNYENRSKIDNLLYIPEYVSIVIEDEKHYKRILEDGLVIDGYSYVRFSCSAGNARVNTVFFIKEDIYNVVNEILKNGAKKIQITKAKYNAYFSLLSSATYKVSEPRVCVVPDYEITLNHEFDFIEDDKKIKRKRVDISGYPPFDGMGIIDIDFCKKWAKDLDLDYIPAQYCIRNAYVKGMVCAMPINEYAKEYEVTKTIKDVWGKSYDIDKIDIILTASQFKLWNAYDSYDEYREKCNKNNISWGITKVSPKNDKKVAFTNYQFVQALNLSDSQIESLCEPTIEWLSSIHGNDVYKTILYMNGSEIKFDEMTDLPMKALILENRLIEDPYIKNKIIRTTNKKIKQACSGKLLTNGQFSVMVSDPYALMQYACGHRVTGLLNDREHYCNFWNERGIDNVAACRSPLTWRSEVNILNLKKNSDTERWYRYLKSGVIYNIYGDDTMKHADSDFDMDIVYTTDKKEFVDGAYLDERPITYNKKTVPKELINDEELYEADISAFNSKIGFITNVDTTMYEMITMYERDSPEYQELYYRLKYSRKLQGDEIDKAKGVDVDEFPKYWTDFNIVKEMDNIDENLKNMYKKLVVSKRPYFMRFVYDHYNREYNKFLNDMENYSQSKFLCSWKDNKNAEFIDMFNKKSPLLENTTGVMNRVARYMESKIQEINRDDKRIASDDIVDILMPVGEFKCEYELTIKKLLKQYKTNKNKLRKEMIGSKNPSSMLDKNIKTMSEGIKNEMFELGDDIDNILYTAIKICYTNRNNDDKDFIWSVFGDEVIDVLTKKVKRPVYIPVLSETGNIEYLGEKYKMEELKL